MDPEMSHIHAFIESFVRTRYRARLRLKPDEAVDDLCHDMPGKLDGRFAVVLGKAEQAAAIVAVLRAISKARTAWFVTAFAGPAEGEYPLEEAVGHVDAIGAAIASVEAGEVVYYKSEIGWAREGGVVSDRALLVRDPGRRERAKALLRKAR